MRSGLNNRSELSGAAGFGDGGVISFSNTKGILTGHGGN